MPSTIGRRIMRRRRNNRNAGCVRIERRRLRDTLDPFVTLSEGQFIDLFRLNKQIMLVLIQELHPYMEERMRATGLPTSLRILTAINFYATGGYQRSVGQNFFLAVSQTSVSRCVEEVSEAIHYLAVEYVRFPTEAEYVDIKLGFYEVCEFPGVVGLVDGTHVKIKAPDSDIEHVYYCRKGGHSKNVQIVCGQNLEIYNVNAKFGGSAHDAYIWRSSKYKTHLETMFRNGTRDFWVLGDSGYPLQPWLMTPIGTETSEGEKKYNIAHKKTRHIVERCIGVLKSRFRCLLHQRVLCYSPFRSGQIINACVVLHNMLIKANYFVENEEILLEDEDDDDIPENANTDNANVLREARGIQQRIIRNYF